MPAPAIRLTRSLLLAAIALAVPLSVPARGDAGSDSDSDSPEQLYLREIKPLLAERCYACHGALKRQAGLRLDTVELIRQGGDAGPAVDTEDPEASPLLERVVETDPQLRMPPEGEPLEPEQIRAIREWIARGAPAPANERPEPDPREHWAFQAPRKHPLPGTDPAENPVDAFIDADLAARKLVPAPPASKTALARRVFIDLTGLPPTREELHRFLADPSPDAYEKLVDRLLESPRHAERWARHWMDVWRYADWHGRRAVPDVWNSAPQIWRWRDWIVRSLHENRGYDRMVREMLAADELAPLDDEATYATGFLVRNWYALNPNDWMRANVEHTAKAFLALTFNCAHCHDHKYDPIAQEDYFRFRAFFEPLGLRQDRVPGEPDPGPFQEYDYSVLRKVQRLGAVRVYDKNPEAPTWFYTGGDERNRVTERGSIPPGLPRFLAEGLPPIETVPYPPAFQRPDLRPAIRQTLLDDARNALEQAVEARKGLPESDSPDPQALEKLEIARRNLDDALRQAAEAGTPPVLAGTQSLLLDARSGRRALSRSLEHLAELPDGTSIRFLVRILSDAHFNFQLLDDLAGGRTALFVGFESGRVLSYKPGTTSEFEAGRFDRLEPGADRLEVRLRLEPSADRALLSVRAVPNNRIVVPETPVALNRWNPVGNPAKPLFLDARPGALALLDELLVLPPGPDSETGAESEPVAAFRFEPPLHAPDSEIAGVDGWTPHPFSQPPAFSRATADGAVPALVEARAALRAAERALERPRLRVRAADARVARARAELEALEARIAAELAKHFPPERAAAELGLEAPPAPEFARELAKRAARAERTARGAARRAQALDAELALADAEALPADNPERAKALAEANAARAAAPLAAAADLESDQPATESESESEEYTPLGRVHAPAGTGRRSALARWITRPENPLAARVAVNHIWMRHFQAPLVPTVNDFGRAGSPPTHPELLDRLAVEFVESGWDMKRLHKVLVTSRAYRRASAFPDPRDPARAANLAADPNNERYWRFPVGRLDAEVVRDAILHLADRLDSAMGGQELENETSLTTRRRSLYYATHPEDGGKSPFGELFDGPDPTECYRRARSVIPQQALILANSAFVHEMSAALAENLTKTLDAERSEHSNPSGSEIESESESESQSESDPDARFVVAAFETVLARPPSEPELRLARKLLLENPEKAGEARAALVRVLFNHNDFVAVR